MHESTRGFLRSIPPFLLLFAAACGAAAPDSASDAAMPVVDMGIIDTLPPGWSEASHTSKGAADYGKVFPQNAVLRIDVTISAADWKIMQDDMVSLLGPFGSGGGFPGGMGGPRDGGIGGGLPGEFTAACEGKAVGESCHVSFMGNAFDSTCANLVGALACLPPMGGPMGDGGTGGPPGGGGGDLIGRNPVYVPSTVKLGDRQWNHVGIRFKGNSSLLGTWGSGVGKLPLHLSFDKYEDQYPLTRDQRLWGFKELSLSNDQGDLSFIREKVANDLYRAAGVPTPVSAFYRVYVDFGQGATYFGLYTADELPASPLLKTLFGESKGNLYKPEGTGAAWGAFDQASFAKKSNEDQRDWSDIQSAITALHSSRADAIAWRQGLEKTFDVTAFMRWLAVNTLIQNWDTYGAMAHNYYLYGSAATGGQLQWIQWDSSLALQSGQGLSFEMKEVTAAWPLIRYTMDDPTYQKSYYGSLREVATGVFSEANATARFRAAHDLVAPYVTGPQGEIKGYTFLSNPALFERSVDELVAHAKSRQQAAQQVLMNH